MPQMGVSVSEGTITKWLKQPGEAIARDEPLLEISTDKVDTEVPSPGEGVLAEILVPEGQTVDVGTVLGRIGPAGSEPAAPEAPAAAAPTAAPAPAEQPAADAEVVVAAPPPAPAAEPEPAARTRCSACRRRSADGDGWQRTGVRLPRRRAHRRRARRRSRRCLGHRHGGPRHEEGHPGVHRVGRRRACAGTSPCTCPGADCSAARTADHRARTAYSRACTDSRASTGAASAETKRRSHRRSPSRSRRPSRPCPDPRPRPDRRRPSPRSRQPARRSSR